MSASPQKCPANVPQKQSKKTILLANKAKFKPRSNKEKKNFYLIEKH
jgi:hypothetical protein